MPCLPLITKLGVDKERSVSSCTTSLATIPSKLPKKEGEQITTAVVESHSALQLVHDGIKGRIQKRLRRCLIPGVDRQSNGRRVSNNDLQELPLWSCEIGDLTSDLTLCILTAYSMHVKCNLYLPSVSGWWN